jgi:hypothetical protein
VPTYRARRRRLLLRLIGVSMSNIPLLSSVAIRFGERR